MKISITKNISNKDNNELLSGLKRYNLNFVNPGVCRVLGFFAHNDSDELG